MSELMYLFNMSILPDEEGGGYLIEFPDLPGCISDGETIDEAIVNGKDALFCWIETAKQHGDEIPQPRPSADSSEFLNKGTEQEENPAGIDLHNVIRQYESFPKISPATWQFDWAVTCP
jgi:predicted RNase H-like HicB family nuclease